MVRRLSLLAAVVAFVGLALPTQAEAQWTLYVEGGATFPSGDFSDYAKTGWMGIGGFVFDVSGGLSLGVEGFYGSNSHDDYDFDTTGSILSGANFSAVGSAAASDKTDLYGFMGTLSYFFHVGGNIQPYAFGGLGMMWHSFKSDLFENESESAFAYELGAGVSFGLSESMSIFGEGRYMAATGDISDTKLFGIFAGLAFGM